MTSEYAQYRQWQCVCDALVRLAHRPLDPVVISELVVDKTASGETSSRMRVALLLCHGCHAYIFEAQREQIGVGCDWRIEMSVVWADFADDNDEDAPVTIPRLLETRLDASASQIALEILHLIE